MYFNPEGKLSFYLSQEEWMKCKPKKGEQKLRQGWSDIMAEHLKKIIPSCSFSFKHHYLSKKCGYPYFKQYFTATAKCKVPGCAEFKLSMKKPIESQPTKVSVQVSKQIIHPESFKHKRQLRREKRRQAQRDMASKKPSEFFYEKVADLNVEELVFGNQTSCQSRSVLKNAAYEYNLQNVVHSDPITELIIIKHAIKDIDFTSSEVKGYIHATNLDPFSASLYTEEQLKLTKEHFKHGSSVLYLDATGSVIQKRPGSKKAIFYYALVLKGETDSPPLPVMEWVSEDHTVPKITSALLNFNYDLNKVGCKKNPRRVEIDFSWALIHSVLKVYSEKNIATYLEDTFKLLVMEEACPKFTIIHICAAHMIKNIRTSLGKVTDDKRLAELLTRCFAYIQNRTSMKAVRRMWELMLKVFMPSKKDTTAVKQLKETLSGTEVEETLEDGHYPQDDLPDTKEQTIRKKSPFYKLFKINMEQHSDEKESSSVDNNYRAVKAMYMLLNDYLPLIPLWSGLLFPFTGEKITRDSNSAVENWFRIVKKDIVQGKTKLRVGQFVLSLYKSLKGRVKARVFNFDIPAKRKTSKNDEENFMGASEKWGPKTPKKTKQRPKYFEKTSNLPSPKRQEPKEATYPLHGIPNTAQICWLSSSLQCLAHQDLVIESKYVKCIAFLAHLSQMLIGELIVYTCSGVRPSVVRRRPQFQTSSSPKPLARSV